MKIKNKILLIFSISLIAFALCACGDTQSSKSFSTIAEEFTEALYQEDYETCISYIDEFYQEDINEDALREIVSGTTMQFGKYQGTTEGTNSTVSEYLEIMGLNDTYSAEDFNLSVYYQPVTMENSNFAFFFLFDPSSRMICSVSICTETEMLESISPGTENNDEDTAE